MKLLSHTLCGLLTTVVLAASACGSSQVPTGDGGGPLVGDGGGGGALDGGTFGGGDGGAEPDDGGIGGRSDGGTGGGTDGGTDGGATVVTLDQALTCGAPGPAGGLAAGDSLHRIDVDTSAFPDAICNDGTGAVFYVRRYQGAENAGRWAFWLQGGGACTSPTDCANRWCSYQTNFGMKKMSSRLAPLGGIAGRGLQRESADNPFAGWNHVLLYYCSSDSWAGTRRGAQVTATAPQGQEVTYTIHFLGARILEAVIDTLRRHEGKVVGYVRNTGGGTEEVAMPNLDDATQVLLTGSSAGGGGVKNNLDRLAGRLASTNTQCQGGGACPLEVRGVIDAAFGPATETLDYSTAGVCDRLGIAAQDCTWEVVNRFLWGAVRGGFHASRGDASCESWHTAHDPGSEWKCADRDHVALHHITTPFFVRMDLRDNLIMGNSVEAGYSVPSAGGAQMTEGLFGQLVAAQLAGLEDIQSTAEEGAAIAVVPGAFGPACGHHESIHNNEATFGVRIDVGGTEYRTVDVLRSWLTGGTPRAAIASPGNLVCP